ncbi:cytochrome c peroxidase [Pseudoalteromonas denitrificans]|uniref:Cytochrome c peroxidase n=1 Tax=Pseudoalteromonas denitrificans DSM 6059 TaxID=1123010 RepID=A0A1I1LRH1_9GAMM|nr:cytochrome c peroxidase [Pseudoalteromonas denitrificans]SFC72893.1 cytochrome c peroxidase [Pseudoalteromonas denitrificans DSM 6059]
MKKNILIRSFILSGLISFSTLAANQISTHDTISANAPPSDGDNRPPGGGDNRPPGGGDNRPPGGGDNRPPGGGDNRPPGGGDNRPPGGGDNRPPGGGDNRPPGGGGAPIPLEEAEQRLQNLVLQLGLAGTSNEQLNLPQITDPKPQLGKQLFFAKNLGGEQSAACVSCHHPALGGGDNLSLSVGVEAVDEINQSKHDLLGHGRFNGAQDKNLPAVPRNAPTVFNIGLLNRGLFWDSRVETRRNGRITTPDSALNQDGRRLPDENLPENTTLAAAQARFPVTSIEEMRGQFIPDIDNESLRTALTERFNNSSNEFVSSWPIAFEQAFGDSNVNFNRIAEAIGEYERSMVFVNNPWNAYLNGDNAALTDEQKAGAVLFFSGRRDGGANCAACHNGPTFSNSRHHLVAFPQIGPGTGNASNTGTSHDFGRENVTNNQAERFHFRTPSLLNIAKTAPYGHTGAFQNLTQVVSHYANPRSSIDNLFAAQNGVPFSNGQIAGFCQLPQVLDLMQKNNQDCETLYPDAYANSIATVSHLEQAQREPNLARAPLRRNIRISPEQVTQIVAFLHALTDPCTESSECLSPWVVSEQNIASFPDDKPLIATDKEGSNL